MKLFPMFPPRTKILTPSLYTVYTVSLSVVTCAPPSKFLYVADPMVLYILLILQYIYGVLYSLVSSPYMVMETCMHMPVKLS